MKKNFEFVQTVPLQYGAKELLSYQKKAVVYAFIVSITLFGALMLLLPNLFSLDKIIETDYIPTSTGGTIDFKPQKSNKPDVVIKGGKVAKAGTGMIAGNPNAKSDDLFDNTKKIEFSDTKNMGASYSDGREGDGLVISTNPSAKNTITMVEPSNSTTAYPDPEEVVFYEKDAFVNLGELQKLVTYPRFAQIAGISGNVVIQVLISVDGTPLKTIILSSDNSIFEEPSRDAVMKMKYEPAIQNGQKVSSWLIIPITFKLK